MIRLEGVPAAGVRGMLPCLTEAFYLMEQQSNGRWLAEDIVRLIEGQDMQLWIAVDGMVVRAVMLTEIVCYPRRKALRAVAGVGKNWRQWGGLHTQIMDWGRANGCDLFEVYAPRKWRHMFPEFTEYHVMMECG